MTKDDTYCVDNMFSGVGKYTLWPYSDYAKRIVFDSLEQCIIYCDVIGVDLIYAQNGKRINKK